MSKSASFYCLLGAVLGLGAGYFFAQARAGRVAANSYATFQMIDLGESSERAQRAYEHESVPVAIYAMTELLAKQKAAEQAGGTAFMSSQMLSIDLMLTHARLGKLYGESGMTNASVEHFAEALSYARADSNLAITNKDTLMDFVTKIDKNAK